MSNWDFKEGIAFAAILSILGALASTNLDITPNQRIMSWLLFVVMAGASINVVGMNTRSLLIAAFLPSASFVVALLFIYFINALQGTPVIGSAGAIDWNDIRSTTGLEFNTFLVAFHVILLIITASGLLVAIVARNIVRKIIRSLLSVDPKDINKKEKVFNSILRISLTMLAIFSVFG